MSVSSLELILGIKMETIITLSGEEHGLKVFRRQVVKLLARVDRGQDFRPRPRPRKIQLVKTEAEDNRGFFFLTEAEAEECKF